MKEIEKQNDDYSFYDLFVPLTTKKAIFIIIAVGCIVYFNMLFNSFVWDDKSYILFNSELQTFNLIHFFGVNAFNSAGYYRPIPAIFFAFLYNIFGTQSFFYHFFQLCLHIIDTCLLFYFLKKFFRISISFFLALVFLVHPIQVESVAFISASQSVLFFFFGILGLLYSTKKVIRWKDFTIISILLLLSLLTKETGILFIFTTLLFQFFYQRKRILIFLPYVIVTSGIYLFIRFILAKVYLQTKEFTPLGQLPLSERIFNIPKIIYYYIQTFFYPAKLSVDQLWAIKTIDLQDFYYPLSLDIVFFFCIGLFGIYLFKTNKHFFTLYLFFFLWFIAGLTMLLQIFPLDMTVSERWFYFPIVGLLGILGIVIETIKLKNNNFRKIGYIVAVGILIIFSIRTMVRNTNWANEITLYSHDSVISDNYDIEDNLGSELWNEHQYQAALPHLKKSEEENTTFINLYNLGYVYEQLGDYTNAERYYELALIQKDIPDGQITVLQHLYDGLVRIFTLHYNPAIEKVSFEKMAKKYPDDTIYWENLALYEYALGEQQTALVSAKKTETPSHNSITNQLYRMIKTKQITRVND